MDKSQRLARDLKKLNWRIDKLNEASKRLTAWRLGIALIGFIVTIFAYDIWGVSLFVVSGLFFGGIFSYLVKIHRKVKYHLLRFKVWKDLKTKDQLRLARDWSQLPLYSESNKDHPFATDLDIIGQGSVLHLLDTSLTKMGYQRLKSWLLSETPDPQATHQRQTLVQELKPLTRFRHGLSLSLFESAQAFRQAISEEEKWDTHEILEFLKGFSAHPKLKATLIPLCILAACNWTFYIGAQLLGWPAWLWQGSLSLYVLLFFNKKHYIDTLFKESFQLNFHFYKLKDLFQYLEAQSFPSRPHLQTLLVPFQDLQERPSQVLKPLQWVVSAGSIQGNPMAWVVLNLIMPWDFIFAHLLNRIKPRLQAKLPLWLNQVTELEALSALAHYAWLHPRYTVPQLSQNSPFVLTDLGHPLLAGNKKVRNNFSAQGMGSAFLITGSNMAGKSTFLKSIGINLSLAYAGTVVDSDDFQAPFFRMFTCIKVSDSVQDGLSYFYAEVKRLKALLDALEAEADFPLFFLIDEIFKGTNNKERFLGSQAYIQALTHKNGLGGISTHDLELVNLAKVNDKITNYHFRENIVAGKMSFDYTLRTGPCPTTNALKIMEIEGLPVIYQSEL